MWFTLEKLLQAVRARVESVLSEARINDPQIKENLKKAALERLGEDHVDKAMVDPFLIPLVIIGAKYDLFQVRLYKYKHILQSSDILQCIFFI